MRKDWAEIELGEAGKIVSGGTPKTKVPEYWGGEIAWITPADLSGYSSKYISKGRKSITSLGLENSSARLMPKNSVLFSSRAPIGYVAIANNDLATNQGFKSLVPYPAVNSNYVYWYLKYAKQIAVENASGTTFKEISATAFSKLPFKLAPIPEQRAIVAKIEQLFSELDNGIANLTAAKDKLEIYRQAVLKKAFEGGLTDTKITKRSLSDFVALVTKGSSPKWQGFSYINDSSQLLFITSENVREGYIDLEKKKYLPLGFNEVQKRSMLKKGDILFNIVGASIGRAAIYNLEAICNVNQAVAIIRLREDLSNVYLNYYLNSEMAKHEYLKKRVDVARANLSLKDVNGIKIPYCSYEKQLLITEEIESRLSHCDNILSNIEEGLEKSEALRQSILKQAFEGKLLSETELEACRNEPDWEPAEKLLKRIKNTKIELKEA
ncbi:MULTISPECIES: restriction endonuclease subunit S [unclassified Robiginitalea]|uniref:restriction endonuclease subunit S n=1 Tax=Robiginitalea TaxID=252306 RepID=UPI00234BA7C7|nr:MULTISPECIES: restriction endonuclease subunit S [unclassified Robiginitalea]MDC6353279.1 restriction endonuclease subunit S [Robiginitalea sp. PM2]MDC6373555.1 restriction endonuclease subunit S [Robiginitalea sp. SP8]